MNDDILKDYYIIQKIKEKEIESEHRIQLEIPSYYDYNVELEDKKEEEEPKRVIIIDL